jgi:hypothetical protein
MREGDEGQARARVPTSSLVRTEVGGRNLPHALVLDRYKLFWRLGIPRLSTRQAIEPLRPVAPRLVGHLCPAAHEMASG